MPPAPDNAEPPPGSWTRFWQSVVRFESEKMDLWLALRNSVGVLLPLAVATATGSIAAGVVIASGALNVAFSDNSDPYA